jgi:hypothetical protein
MKLVRNVEDNMEQDDIRSNETHSANEHAAERIRRIATRLGRVGDALRPEDGLASSVMQRASIGFGRLANYVSSTDLPRFVRDMEQLARRQPILFFGGTFLAGLALGRFMKSLTPAQPWNGSPHERDNFDTTFARDLARSAAAAPATKNSDESMTPEKSRTRPTEPNGNGPAAKTRSS